MVGDLGAASWRPVRLTPGTCFSVAAGAPLPIGADVVVPVHWTDQGMAAVEIFARAQARVRRTPRRRGAAGRHAARPRRHVRDRRRWSRCFAATGIGHVVVRPSPRVVVVATGDELVDVGRASQPGQVVDANSHALTAAAAEAGALAYRIGICDDDPEGLRGLLEDQTLRADLIITTGGTGTGPGRHGAPGAVPARRRPRRPVAFTDVALYPGTRRSASARSAPRRCRWSACPATRRRADRLRGAGPPGDPAARRRRAGVPAQRAGAPAGDRRRRPAGCASSGRRTSPSGAAAGTRCSRSPVGRTRSPAWPRPTGCWCSASGSPRRRPARPWTCCCSDRTAMMLAVHARLACAVLADGPGAAAPVPARSDGRAPGPRCGSRNQEWLAPWESSPPGRWAEMNSTGARSAACYRDHAARRPARGEGMPFAVCLREDGRERLVGHLNLGNIVRRAFCSGVRRLLGGRPGRRPRRDPDRAGARRRPRLRPRRAAPHRGQHPPGEQARPAGWWRSSASARRRTTQRYMHIDGAWRDHIGYALTSEEVAAEGGLLARWHRRTRLPAR